MPHAGMEKGSLLAKRVRLLKEELEEEGLRGTVIVPGPNMKYFTGVESLLLERPFMLLVPVEGDLHLVAPALEVGPYGDVPLPLKIHPWTDSEGPAEAVYGAAKGAGMKGAWGVEGRVPFQFFDRLTGSSKVKLRNAEQILQGLREVKDDAELALLKKSAEIISRSFEQFPSVMSEGMTELELAKKATDLIYDNGATRVDDMLVQSGVRSAVPHGMPTKKKIGRGESIIIDVGVTYEEYYSDITRAFCIGSNAELQKVYEKVLEAEVSGIRAASQGVKVGDVDRAARQVLQKAGLGKYFFHRTGHGLGLEVHEAPYIVEGGTEKLQSGMCFTVEPGAYVRGQHGVRIEDDVIIEGKKGVAITDTPKEYGWWK